MITRWYFISAQKPWLDGSGSYSYSFMQRSYTSWFPSAPYVYGDAIKAITNDLKDKPGDNIMITAFNRC